MHKDYSTSTRSIDEPGLPPSHHGPTVTKISDLRPYMKNQCCVFIVLEKTVESSTNKTGEETKITQCLVADASASILLSLGDAKGDSLQPGDIIRLTSGYCTLFKSALVLCAGRHGILERLGEFTMVFSETPNMSTLSWGTDPQNPKIIVPLRTSGGRISPSLMAPQTVEAAGGLTGLQSKRKG